VALRLTASGKRKFDAAVREAEAYLSARIEQLEPQVRGEVLRSMTALHVLFEEDARGAPILPAPDALAPHVQLRKCKPHPP
jgi:hypothetical protein